MAEEERLEESVEEKISVTEEQQNINVNIKREGEVTGNIITKYINDRKIQITLPEEYTAEIHNEKNRRGSVAAYALINYDKKIKNDHLIIDEVQFFTQEFLKDYNYLEYSDTCFYTDCPYLEDYNAELNAFNKKESYKKKELEMINNRKYHVSYLGSCLIGCSIQYTTYIDNVRIDFWTLSIGDKFLKNESDELIKQIKITIDNL